MRALLYAVGGLAMFLAGFVLVSLPHWQLDLWLFMISGTLLSGVLSGGWLLVGATAGDWPRPRTCHVLLLSGAVGLAAGLWTGEALMLGWSGLFLLAGAGFLLPGMRIRRAGARVTVSRGPVKPPISRREQG